MTENRALDLVLASKRKRGIRYAETEEYLEAKSKEIE